MRGTDVPELRTKEIQRWFFQGAIAFGLLLALLMLFTCVSNAPASYDLHSVDEPSNRSAEIRVLQQLNQSYPCEYMGKMIERHGRPALRFQVSRDDQSFECLRKVVPDRYVLEKATW